MKLSSTSQTPLCHNGQFNSAIHVKIINYLKFLPENEGHNVEDGIITDNVKV